MSDVRLTTHQKTGGEFTQRLEALAKQQAVRPLQDMAQLRDDFWPEDENLKDFVQAVRNWRQDQANRSRR